MNPWHKLAFLIGQWLALRGIASVVGLVLPPYVAGPLMLALLTVVTVALARSFRGPGEPVFPPRAWWRLTARPLAGWWLGAYFLLPLVALLGTILGPRFPVTLSGVLETVLSCALAAGFFQLVCPPGSAVVRKAVRQTKR